MHLSLESVDSLWESNSLLSGLQGDSSSIFLGQSSSDGSGLLLSQVLWNVLLTSVQSSDVSSLVSSDHSQNSGDVLSDEGDLWDSWLGQLLDLEGSQFLLQLSQLGLQLLLGLSSQFCNVNTGLNVSINILRSLGILKLSGGDEMFDGDIMASYNANKSSIEYFDC